MDAVVIVKMDSVGPEAARRFGDIVDWIVEGLDLGSSGIEVVDVKAHASLPDTNRPRGVVLTGAWEMVTDELPWSVAVERWLPPVVERGVPVLGICYGHQVLGRALGGKVGYNPAGREIGSVEVELTPEATGDALLGGFPDRFSVQACHSQSVLVLPAGSVVLAGNGHDAHHAVRMGRRAWGVQFHPEFDRREICRLMEKHRRAITDEGLDVDDLMTRTAECPHGAAVLGRFGQIVEG